MWVEAKWTQDKQRVHILSTKREPKMEYIVRRREKFVGRTESVIYSVRDSIGGSNRVARATLGVNARARIGSLRRAVSSMRTYVYQKVYVCRWRHMCVCSRCEQRWAQKVVRPNEQTNSFRRFNTHTQSCTTDEAKHTRSHATLEQLLV